MHSRLEQFNYTGIYELRFSFYNVVVVKQKNQNENQNKMKTIYYSAELHFKSRIPQQIKKDIIEALELATEHHWRKQHGSSPATKYISREFSIMSNLKPPVVFLIIKEYKPYIQEFNFKVYPVDAMPHRMITLTDNRLRYIK